MSRDRSRKFMGFMMSAYESMEIQMFGSALQSCLTICLLQRWCKIRYSVCMVGLVLVLKHSIKSNNWIEFKKHLTKVQYAIYSGPTLTTEWAGAYHHVVQDTPSAKTSVNNSISKIISNSSVELISWS